MSRERLPNRVPSGIFGFEAIDAVSMATEAATCRRAPQQTEQKGR